MEDFRTSSSDAANKKRIDAQTLVINALETENGRLKLKRGEFVAMERMLAEKKRELARAHEERDFAREKMRSDRELNAAKLLSLQAPSVETNATYKEMITHLRDQIKDLQLLNKMLFEKQEKPGKRKREEQEEPESEEEASEMILLSHRQIQLNTLKPIEVSDEDLPEIPISKRRAVTKGARTSKSTKK